MKTKILLIFTLLFCALVFTRCSSDACRGGTETGNPTGCTEPANAAVPGSFTTLDQGANGGGQVAAQFTVIDNDTDFAALWNELTTENLPTVDFTTDMVIAAVMGSQSSGGYVIEITAVDETDGVLTVSVTETSPGAGCIVTASITNPYHVVSIAKTAATVSFDVSEEVTSCE